MLHVPDVFAPLRGGPPSVVTLHDVIPLVCKGQLAKSRKQQLAWVWRRWLKVQCGRVAAVATVSDYSADDIARELGVPPGEDHGHPQRRRAAGWRLGATPGFRKAGTRGCLLDRRRRRGRRQWRRGG